MTRTHKRYSRADLFVSAWTTAAVVVAVIAFLYLIGSL